MMISKIIKFLKTDIWKIRLNKISGIKSFLIRQLRIVVLSLRGFDEDKCMLRASALTFFSILSIVPVLAMAFGIARGFGFEKILQQQLLTKFHGQEEVIVRIINFSQSLLENTKSGMVAGIGVVFLIWLVIRVLGNIENSFNEIWGIKNSRTWARKFSDYLSITLISPILFILSSSITVAITSQVEYVTNKVSFLGTISPVISISLEVLPYLIICGLFAFIYIFMPNTKVKFKSGLLAGIIAGIIYQLLQWGYINFQIGVAKYNAIYGSFAALPLFLIWVQISWLVLFFGAEISFAHQNVETYEFETEHLNISYSFKRLLSLRVVNLIVKNFVEGKEALSSTQISHILEIPVRLVRQIIFDLSNAGIISETFDEVNDIKAYQPAIDTNNITIKKVIDALEKYGNEDIPVAQSKELDKLSEHLQNFTYLIEKSPSNILLKDI